jgi:thymidylate kinase
MDMGLGANLYESFVNYQTRMIAAYERMIEDSHFQIIDATLPAGTIAEQLQDSILPMLPHG